MGWCRSQQKDFTEYNSKDRIMAQKKRIIILISVFSLCISAAVFCSVKMPTDYNTITWLGIQPPMDLLLFAAIWFISGIAVFLVNQLLDKIKYKNTTITLPASAIFLLIFLAWFPFFLSFFPGNLSPDSYASIWQALRRINSTAHPVLFTLLVKICISIGRLLFGNMNAAIAVFSIAQMLLLDGILTYTVVWLKRHKVPRFFLISTILYFSFNPLIVRLSFTMWKDILFSGVLLLLMLLLYDIVTESVSLADRKELYRFLLFSILAAFLRNRISYAVVAIFIVLLLMFQNLWKRLLPIFLGTVVLIFFIQWPLYSYLGITPSNFAEGQGVSLQQIAAVVVNGGEISEEEAAFIDQIIPLEDIPKAYVESTVDNLKGYQTFDHKFLNDHAAEFIQVWQSVVRKNIWISLKAWLMTSRGFWGFNVWIEPFAITWPSEELGIQQVNIIQKLTGVDLSYLSNGILVHIGEVPIVRSFFELGCLGWFGTFCCLRILLKRRYRLLVALLPLILLWLVLIFSTPIFFEARYMFAYSLVLPVLICMMLMGDKLEQPRSTNS